MANLLIAFNSQRHGKVLRPARRNGLAPRVLQFPGEAEEARGVVEEIVQRLKSDKGVTPGDFAILFRTNEQPRPFEWELRKLNVPYVITGTQSFFDRKEVRDILAYLKWIDRPDDELALLRVINVPPRGMGAGSVDKLLREAVSQSKSVWRMMLDPEFVASLPTAAQRGIENLIDIQKKFASLLNASSPETEESSPIAEDDSVTPPESHREEEDGDEESDEDHFYGSGPLSDAVHRLIEELKYRQEIERLYTDADEAVMRIGSLEAVLNAVAVYESSTNDASMDGFLTSVTLSGREYGSSKEKNAGRNAVSLMTYHSAKGLEFPIVYMVGMEEGVLPHRRSITEEGDSVDEERRLCYVGVTRAQDELTLTLPLSRFKWGKARPTYPSRFLYELTGQADNPNRAKSIKAAADDMRKANRQKR
jgi:DNA helicase-2/ATP-dependent DNA helicase PcrA